MKRLFLDPTILTLVVLFALGIALVLLQQQRLNHRLVRSIADEEARRYSAALESFRTLYTSEVVANAEGHIEITHDYDSQEKRGKAIPLPATLSMKLGEAVGTKLEGGSARLYSAFPFPYPSRKKLTDQFARDAWAALVEDPDKPFQREENVNGAPQLRYAIADLMRESCVECHNNHADSPKRDWKVGDVRGVLEVSLPMEVSTKQITANMRESFMLLCGVGGIGLLGLVIVIHRLRRTAQDLETRVQNRTQELEKTTETLRRREVLAGTVITSSPVPLMLVACDGRVTMLNQEAEKLFGYSSDEIVGQSIEILVPKKFRDVHPRLRNQFFENPVAKAVGVGRNLTGVRIDQTEFPLEIGLTPIDTDRGTAVLAALIDLREQKRIENQLAHQANELRVARDSAVNADKAKSDFLANMSHEIRTPMNAIIGLTDLVLDTKLDISQRDYLSTVHASAESLLSIINQILDFSKIEAGKLELESIDFDIREELGDTLKSLGLRAHVKEIELLWHVHSDVPQWLCGDSVRLRQMIINLVGNAIKFTQEGEVTVDVQLKESTDSKVHLQFSVIDTGMGIAENKCKNVFSAFEQADSSTTRQFGGTGLGLAITSRLAEAMGGRIWVESKLGKGSTFHFTVKLGMGSATGSEIELPDLIGFPVLIVDDNETNLEILDEQLNRWGMNVTTVDGAGKAILALQETANNNHPLPLIITDVNMPEMDGFMLAEELRSIPKLKDIVIIMLTSGGRFGDIKRCEKLKVSAHLMKPAKQSELLAAIMLSVGSKLRKQRIEVEPQAELDLNSMPAKKILLAEDGIANQKMAAGLLKKWGHEIVIANNGQEAVDFWRDGSFDLILMDVQMPILDGLDATKQIREIEKDSKERTPIIAMTARAMKGDRERCLDAGMDDYVSKPVRKEELFRAMSELTVTSASKVNVSVVELTADDLAIIDWNLALENAGGDEELLREVVDAVIQEIPELFEKLDLAINENDFESSQRLAHTVKGSGVAIAANKVTQVASAIESATENNDLASARAQILSLRKAIDELIVCCEEKIAKAPPT